MLTIAAGVVLGLLIVGWLARPRTATVDELAAESRARRETLAAREQWVRRGD